MKKKNKNRSNSLLNRALWFQPGLAFGVFGLVFILGGQMLGAGATTTTTPSACKPVAVSNIDSAHPSSNQVAYKINSAGQGGTTTAAVKAGTNCVGPLISLVSYKTTSHDGMPRKAQRIYDSQTKPLALTVVTMSVRVPDCYYQTDLAYGLPLDLSKGIDYGASNFIWGVTGGSRACADMNAASTPTPSASPTPTATVSATPRPTVVVQPVEETPTPTPKDNGKTPTPSPTAVAQGTPTATPEPTPSVIVLAPGEEEVTEVPVATASFNSLPQAGQAGSLMTFLGALLVTAGLLHIYLTQRRKLLKSPRR